MIGTMSSRRRKWGGAVATLAVISGLQIASPPPALADGFGGFVGGFVGGVIGGAFGGAMRPQRGYYGGQTRHNVGSGSGSSPPTQGESSDALASLAPPTNSDQTTVLKSVVPLAALGAVGATDDLQRMNKWDTESDRDYTQIVQDLTKALATKPDDKTQNGRNTTFTSDITQHSVMEALDNAIRSTQLIKFETFRDESWSPERLRVMILERVQIELGDALDQSKHVSMTMHDVDVAFARAAKSVQARLFETSELLAANRDSTLFLLRLYQTHGDVSSDVREHTEKLLQKAAASGVAPFEALLQRDSNGYALHYRGERIVYDCLTENVEAISSGDQGVATEAEIEKRILDTNRDQCAKWVAAQLVSKDGLLKAQEPVPLRVVWSVDGPRTDPSMFSRAPDEL